VTGVFPSSASCTANCVAAANAGYPNTRVSSPETLMFVGTDYKRPLCSAALR
jgi:hypothetical protein